MDLAVAIYECTKRFPADERFARTSQLRRSAASIPANIAEGYARRNRGEYNQFLFIAMGSLAETETHLILATRLKYITRTEAAPIWKLAQEIGKMLHRFTAVLDPKPNKR
ncbi:MAG: four helix bundle protein [Candidatus Hydrogenedentes bacterium]|nr:four helix bundle protein [Candidatus Hydrogenedentota bacterium]